MSRPPAYDDAYPEALWKYERAHLLARVPGRPLPADRPPEGVVGVALSGGGIRSATFCLGVFQALAQLRRLANIDYISTVSGGGYFGTFLGRLYRRREIETAEEVRSLLDPVAPWAARPAKIPDVVESLRENGRYLSPNGAGDLLIGAAIMLRNWVTIHVVVLSFVLLALMSGQLARIGLEMWVDRRWRTMWLAWIGNAPHSSWLWWSPWIVAPVLTLVLWAVPFAWAFWLTGRWKRRKVIEWPVWGVVMTGVIAAIAVVAGLCSRQPSEPGAWPDRVAAAGAVVLITILLTALAWARALRNATSNPRDFRSLESQKVFEIDRQRNYLSGQLKTALVGTGALLAFALVDTIGQTLYLVGMRPESGLLHYLGSALAALGGAAAFAQRIATALSGGTSGTRLRLPLAALVTAGALAAAALLLISLDVLAHGLAWRFREPSGPVISWATTPPSRATINFRVPNAPEGAVTATSIVPVPGQEIPSKTCPSGEPCFRTRRDLIAAAIVTVILLGFAVLFGHCWPFINQSSLHAMYSARITRAFLGASNPRRRVAGKERITEVQPGDNIDPADYWPAPGQGGDPTARPLHLINVTINETVDGKSNVQRQDRKGTCLAIGPCAFSAGVRHHAIFPSHDVLRPDDSEGSRSSRATTVFPQPRAGAESTGYRVFEEPPGESWRGGERLSLGAWTGISGAAFSTGLGARTSLGLSLLCGLANVRLGYWWNSGVDPDCRNKGFRRRPYGLDRIFPVQAYLLSEFVSRFYGTSRRQWYLSDGGHFENMGGYELIRRRLARIVVVDAEADPDYTFEGLANLVRKARLDFGAEIQFLNDQELREAIPDSHYRLFGTLEQLRRGKWTQEPVDARQTDRPRLTVEEPVDEARHSLVHAALARVTFADDPEWTGCLLYIKPTLMGNEPADIVQYHRSHPPFPQETTADQFFDEAQWESYRMLGYHIAMSVFGSGLPAPTPPTTTPPTTTPPTTTPPTPAMRIFGT